MLHSQHRRMTMYVDTPQSMLITSHGSLLDTILFVMHRTASVRSLRFEGR
jgi:hypothetical protein